MTTDEQPVTVRLANHYSILVYPFLHRFGSGTLKGASLSKLEPKWRPYWTRYPKPKTESGSARAGTEVVGREAREIDEMEYVLDDAYFFLPYIRDIIHPEVSLLEQVSGADAGVENDSDSVTRMKIARARTLSERSLGDAPWKDADLDFLRVTLCGEELDKLNEGLHLRPNDKASNHPVRFEWIDTILTAGELGFLCLKFRILGEGSAAAPTTPAEGLSPEEANVLASTTVRALLGAARLVHGPTINHKLAEWTNTSIDAQCKADEEPRVLRSRAIVEWLVQDVAADAKTGGRALEHFAKDDTPLPTIDSSFGQVYGETFQMYTYVCVAPQDEATLSDERSGESSTDRLLFDLANCEDSADPDWAPDPREFARLQATNVLALWRNWRALVLPQHTVWLGRRGTDFAATALKHNTESDYFLVYIFVLMQRLRLSRMFGELLRRDRRDSRNMKQARQLWNRFIEFQNRFWFAELTMKPQGIAIYRAFQLGMGVAPLYQEAREQADLLRSYHEARSERQANRMLAFLTLVGLPLGLLSQLFPEQMRFGAASNSRFATFAIALGCAGLGIWILNGWLLHRRSEVSERNSAN